MAYSIDDAQNELEGMLSGTTLNQITNLIGVENRAARQLLLDVDPQETIRIQEFTAPIFNGVVDYAIAPDVKGLALIDIRPQVRRLPWDLWTQGYNQAFDILKSNVLSVQNQFTLNFNTGLKTIRINAPYLPAPVVVNGIDNTTSNGTWAVGGSASNLQEDNQNFVYGGGSLSFNLPSGAGYLENSTMSALDLTDYLNQGTFFLWVFMPTASQFTSVELRWGSDSSNYYAVTATTTQQNTAFVNGWNLLQFAWLGASVTGSPTVTAIDYVRVTMNTTAVQTVARLNYLTVALGNVLEYEYYSKYLFRDSTTGVFQETVTDVSNLINLDTESYNLYLNLLAAYATQQQQGQNGIINNPFYQDYLEGKKAYKLQNRSQRQKPQSSYYTINKPWRYNGGRYNN